jgi:hypothetical protein
MLANPLNQPRPGGVLDEGVAQEIRRIRNSFVVGLPMPAQSASGLNGGFVPLAADPDGALSFEQLRHISAWIAHGAVTSCP